jgi:DNA-binding HxlR family transcriptional regulator
MRFNELKKEIYGITNTMLSNSLQVMQNDNLVQRVQYNEMPLRVEYSLTDTGKEVLPILLELSKWGLEQKNVQNESSLNNG